MKIISILGLALSVGMTYPILNLNTPDKTEFLVINGVVFLACLSILLIELLQSKLENLQAQHRIILSMAQQEESNGNVNVAIQLYQEAIKYVHKDYEQNNLSALSYIVKNKKIEQIKQKIEDLKNL